MSVSGLVLTLSDDAAADATLSTLAADPRLTIGERFDRRVALVAETQDVETDLELIDKLRRTPGIVNVDVAFVQVDACSDSEVHPCGHGSREERNAHR